MPHKAPLLITIVCGFGFHIPRLPAALDQSCQLARYPTSRDRRVALTDNVVDHVQYPQALAARELVMDEIQRPATSVQWAQDARRQPLTEAILFDLKNWIDNLKDYSCFFCWRYFSGK